MRFVPRSTIGRMVLVTSALSAVTLASFVWFFHRQEISYQRRGAQSKLEIIRILAEEIDHEFANILELLEINASSIPAAANTSGRKWLENRVSLRKNFNCGLFVADEQGRVITEIDAPPAMGGSPAMKDAISRTRANGAITVSAPLSAGLPGINGPIVLIGAPITSAGASGRMLMGCVDIPHASFLSLWAKLRVGQGGYVFMTSPDHRLLLHPDETLLGHWADPNSGEVSPHMAESQGMEEALRQAQPGRETVVETTDWRGVPVLTATIRLKRGDWILGAVYPAAEAFERLRDYEIEAAIGLLIGTLFAALATYGLARSFILPIRDLAKQITGMEWFREGEPPPRVTAPHTFKEIEQLVAALNAMLALISRHLRKARLSAAAFNSSARGDLVVSDTPAATATSGHASKKTIDDNPIVPEALDAAAPTSLPAPAKGRTIEDLRTILGEIPGYDLDIGLQYVPKLKTFVNSLHHYAEIYANSMETARALIRDGQWEEARRIAHTLKGTSGMLGALHVQSLAQELENALLQQQGAARIDALTHAVEDALAALLPAFAAVPVWTA